MEKPPRICNCYMMESGQLLSALEIFFMLIFWQLIFLIEHPYVLFYSLLTDKLCRSIGPESAFTDGKKREDELLKGAGSQCGKMKKILSLENIS